MRRPKKETVYNSLGRREYAKMSTRLSERVALIAGKLTWACDVGRSAGPDAHT